MPTETVLGADRVCNEIPIWLPGDAKLAAKELGAKELAAKELAAKELAANPPWRRAFRT